MKTYLSAVQPQKTASISQPKLNLDEPVVRRLIKERMLQWIVDEAGGNLKRLNWPHVADAIERYGGLRIDTETLRKNFRPSSGRQGKPPSQFREVRIWLALYRFLTSDAVAYLNPADLPSGPFSFNAFAGLQSFIDPVGNSVFADGLIGRFDNHTSGQHNGQRLVTLDFLGSPSSGPVRVELREFSETIQGGEDDERTSFSGGAVHRTDGYLVAFAREAVSQQIRTFLVLETEPARRSGERVLKLGVLYVAGTPETIFLTRA